MDTLELILLSLYLIHAFIILFLVGVVAFIVHDIVTAIRKHERQKRFREWQHEEAEWHGW